ncbi:MAG: hypothetical protein R8J85_10565, partial [Mariprofundales bacterium]
MNPASHIYCGDVLDLVRHDLVEKTFDLVFSLSCIDWNVQFSDMLAAVWSCVVPGGDLVATFRLTAGDGCVSSQHINFDGQMKGERAAYVVLNAKRFIRKLVELDPAVIHAHGYWGAPSP